MKSRFPFISRFLRWWDNRRPTAPSIPTTALTIYAINYTYRARHYWAENRGNG